MSDTIWHGLTYDQWLKLWDHKNWRGVVAEALREVASSPDARTRDRLMSLQVMNEAIMSGAIPADPSYPEMMRDVLLAISRGDKPSKKRKKRRARLHARLLGARWMLQTATQFTPEASTPAQAPMLDAEVDTTSFS